MDHPGIIRLILLILLICTSSCNQDEYYKQAFHENARLSLPDQSERVRLMENLEERIRAAENENDYDLVLQLLSEKQKQARLSEERKMSFLNDRS